MIFSGDFPNQNPRVDGLSVWTERDAALVDVDLVVWHIFGMTHVRTVLLTCHACITLSQYPPAYKVKHLYFMNLVPTITIFKMSLSPVQYFTTDSPSNTLLSRDVK